MFLRARAEHGDGYEPRFLCVSRFIPKKNLLGLLDAFDLYLQQGGSWSLELVGSGPLEGQLRERVRMLREPRRVSFRPFLQLPQLTQAYVAAGAFILASHTDQWGLVVNEAMAAGLPVLVSHACGCAVDLVDHGVTGYTFSPDDPSALAAAMHQTETQSTAARQAMVAAGRQRLQAFSPERFAVGLADAVEHARTRPRRSVTGAHLAQLMSQVFSRR
jgi:glycosyltransferase involved in cell wall biosynthesis